MNPLAKTTSSVIAEWGILNSGSIPKAAKGHTEKHDRKLVISLVKQ